jgi:hypothetical protein
MAECFRADQLLMKQDLIDKYFPQISVENADKQDDPANVTVPPSAA